MTGENDNNQSNEGGGNQDDGDNNEPIVIPEQSPFTNPGQTTARTEKPIKHSLIPNSND